MSGVDLALELIKKSESFQPKRYLDPAGLPTIGYGRLLHGQKDPLWNATITEAQAAAMIEDTLSSLENQLRTALSQAKYDGLSSGQQAALLDFCYNLGFGRFMASTLYTDIQDGRMDDAANQFGRWVHGGNPPVVLSGLVTRRKAEKALWLSA